MKHLFEKMLSVIEPDGAENFSIGQIIQVRELKVPISDNRRRLDITTIQIGIFVTKIVLTYCEKKNYSDREFFLKFEAEKAENLQKI